MVGLVKMCGVEWLSRGGGGGILWPCVGTCTYIMHMAYVRMYVWWLYARAGADGVTVTVTIAVTVTVCFASLISVSEYEYEAAQIRTRVRIRI